MSEKMTKTKKILLPIAFVLIFVILFLFASRILQRNSESKRFYQYIKGFYSLEEDSVDAVFIGSSKVYTSWIPTYAWENYGINVYNFACASVNLTATKNLIEEARKTQPNALMIVNINGREFKAMPVAHFHHLSDNIKFSLNKLDLIKNVTAYFEDYSFIDKMEYVFPIIRFHSRWTEFRPSELLWMPDGTLGASTYFSYLGKSKSYKDKLSMSETTGQLNAEQKAFLDDLLDYCEDNNVRILFTTDPQCKLDEEDSMEQNAILEYISSRGFDTFNMKVKAKEMNIDESHDFYNKRHLNVHGGIKFTEYFAKYLVDTYGFSDKRGNEKYAQWDRAYDLYKEKLDHYVFDIEYDMEHRDYSLNAPRKFKLTVDGQNVALTWKDSGADGYEVYMRHDKESKWEKIGETVRDSYGVHHSGNIETKYTVIPYVIKDGVRYYGNFHYVGEGYVKEEEE